MLQEASEAFQRLSEASQERGTLFGECYEQPGEKGLEQPAVRPGQAHLVSGRRKRTNSRNSGAQDSGGVAGAW